MKIKDLERLVIKALEDCKSTRSDDFKLYAVVLYYKGVDVEANLFDFLKNAKKNKMPAFESVSRCRRHIQELRQDLKDTKTAIKREELQEEYVNYNLSGLGEKY